MKIKAITLWQPWASFMAKGLKKNETRSWSTKYRGPLAIHAAKRTEWDEIPPDVLHLAIEQFGHTRYWPYGEILCVVDLVSVIPTDSLVWSETLSSLELMLGNYNIGRFAWETKLLHVFEEPIPAKGKQGLWDWEGPVTERKNGSIQG